MENVVYLLGAGFSAPLGLPVMDNFLEKSKDMYFETPDKFKHFLKVFDTIKEMSISKNYFSTDLFNIEEILSILEMKTSLGENGSSRFFIKYIIDVINHFTPSIVPHKNPLIGNWNEHIFGDKPIANYYGYFVSSLLNAQTTRRIVEDNYGNKSPIYKLSKDSNHQAKYSVITLNYDLVIENYCNFLNQNLEFCNDIKFIKPYNNFNVESSKFPVIAKLHGSIDTGKIIPPTWNKLLNKREIKDAWKAAHKLLIKANHIRIIGYSLPTTDSYVRYLFKSAIIYSLHLKNIDVICLDHNGEIKKRYDEFIQFKNYRFIPEDTLNYLKQNFELNESFERPDSKTMKGSFNRLEQAHNSFMTSYILLHQSN
ncbi:SIR2 family protein [candidate division KSB1 bacterium]|nr:SIR2 family protein [candidate division KSB1 bacterium]